MKTDQQKIIFVVLATSIFSICNIYVSSAPFDLMSFVINCVVLLIFSFVIFGILAIFRLKKWGFLEVFYRSFIVALVIGGLSIFGNYRLNSKSSNQEMDNDKYKKIVNKTNENPVKIIGDVRQEFLNEDNLYENYVYNYAIKFPKDFKLNYGVGEYSNILAYSDKTSRQIAISVGDNNLNYSFSNEQANELLESMIEKNVNSMIVTMTNKWTTEGSYQNIEFVEKELVNYYNKKFIKLTFAATRNLNNIDYEFVMTDFITLFKTSNYHILFEGPKPQNELDSMSWKNLLFTTMAGVRITEVITQ